MPLNVDWAVHINGQNYTARFNPYVMEIEVTDGSGKDADRARITLADDGRIILPKKGAPILGNLGHESAGFKSLQEKRPLVPGSRGGYGYAQWTGPRRKAYEAWCAAKAIDPAGDEANFSFLVHELQTSEKRAIPAVKAAEGLEAKVKAFELAFERASVNHKHYESRNAWAGIAYRAITGEPIDIEVPAPPRRPKAERVWAESLLSVEDVKYVQRRYIELGYPEVGLIDGDWTQDGKVAAATKLIQARAKALGENIKVDGHYGPQTKNLIDPAHGNKYRREVSAKRAGTKADDLAKLGTPGVVVGRRIQWASIFGLVSAVVGAAFTAWQAVKSGTAEMPFGSSVALAFLPPWVSAVAPFLFQFLPLAYAAVAGRGLVGTTVERFREGTDNTGLPPESERGPGGLFGSWFGR